MPSEKLAEKQEKKPEKKKNRLKKYIIGKKEDFMRNLNKVKKSDDMGALKELIFECLMYGIPIGSIVSYLLSTPLIKTIIIMGLFMVLFDKKLLYMVSQILSSFKIVQINR